ncbi:hypothetical protein DPSP01_005500 [Paraphaeosphaeria sporulosa]
MAHHPTAKPQLACEYTATSTTITKLSCHFNDTYDTIIQKFRLQVPLLDISRMRAATKDKEISQAVEASGSPSGFVLFAEYNHAGWMRHFTIHGKPLQRAHRFTFGNPLFALPVLQHSIQAALHIPLDCCFIEELDRKRTKMIVTLPTTFLGSTEVDVDAARLALAEIEGKLLTLVQQLTPQT